MQAETPESKNELCASQRNSDTQENKSHLHIAIARHTGQQHLLGFSITHLNDLTSDEVALKRSSWKDDSNSSKPHGCLNFRILSRLDQHPLTSNHNPFMKSSHKKIKKVQLPMKIHEMPSFSDLMTII